MAMTGDNDYIKYDKEPPIEEPQKEVTAKGPTGQKEPDKAAAPAATDGSHEGAGASTDGNGYTFTAKELYEKDPATAGKMLNPSEFLSADGKGLHAVSAKEVGEAGAPKTAPTTALSGYDNSIRLLEGELAKLHVETPQEKEKREKRERSQRIISAVSDGIRSLSNLYFTSRYAPNMYNHEKDSAQAKVDARIEKAKAQRDADRQAYLNYALKIGALQNQKAKTVEEARALAEKQRLAREAAAREEEKLKFLRELQPDKVREQTGKADAAEADAKTKGAAAEHAEELQTAKVATEKARGESARASAASSRASASAHGRSNVAEFVAYDRNGRAHYFHTEAAATSYARQHGTDVTEQKRETTTQTRTNQHGKNTSATSTKSGPGKTFAGKPKKANPMGSSGKKKNPMS